MVFCVVNLLLKHPLDDALMLKIYGSFLEQQKQKHNSNITSVDLDQLKLLISTKTSLIDFVSQFRRILSKEVDERWTTEKAKTSPFGRPLFLHFDEVGGLDHPALMRHLECKEPRDVFYLFWATLDDIMKQPRTFI